MVAAVAMETIPRPEASPGSRGSEAERTVSPLLAAQGSGPGAVWEKGGGGHGMWWWETEEARAREVVDWWLMSAGRGRGREDDGDVSAELRRGRGRSQRAGIQCSPSNPCWAWTCGISESRNTGPQYWSQSVVGTFSRGKRGDGEC